MLEHYYHVYSHGAWRTPAIEHMRFLKGSGLYEELDVFRIGIVGPTEDVLEILEGAEIVAVSDTGWEQVTMAPMQELCSQESFVLYCHTKGASRKREPEGNQMADDIGHRWRRFMSDAVITRWRDCIAALETGEIDSVGAQWEAGEPGRKIWPGNYWWATGSYLKSLTLKNNTRDDAEFFIGVPDDARMFDIRSDCGWNGPNWPRVLLP